MSAHHHRLRRAALPRRHAAATGRRSAGAHGRGQSRACTRSRRHARPRRAEDVSVPGGRSSARVYHKEPDQDQDRVHRRRTRGSPSSSTSSTRASNRRRTGSDVYEVTRSRRRHDDARSARPRKQGNVAIIEAEVDDKTATVTSMRWTYANGGVRRDVHNRYGTIDGNTRGRVADRARRGARLHGGHHLDDRQLQDQPAAAGRDLRRSRRHGDLTSTLSIDGFNRADHLPARLGDGQLQPALRLLHARRRACRGCDATRSSATKRSPRSSGRPRIGGRAQHPADRRRAAGPPRSRTGSSRSIAAMPGIDDIALSTNGLLLAEQVDGLVAAGLHARQHLARHAARRSLRSDRAPARARRVLARDRRRVRAPASDRSNSTAS